jgi:hypothetical protein
MIECTVRLVARQGTFQPDSFAEWIGHEIQATGLDPAYRHVLRSVEGTEDGTSSLLTVHTYSDVDANLTANMSVLPGTPKAQVRAHVGGELVATAMLDAPLQPGQQVLVNDQLHQVVDVSHPARNDDGTTTGEDHQHVDLRPTDEPVAVVDLGLAAGILGLLGG